MNTEETIDIMKQLDSMYFEWRDKYIDSIKFLRKDLAEKDVKRLFRLLEGYIPVDN